MEPGVDLHRDGAVAIVTIRDPGRRNALSAPIRAGLIETFTAVLAESDPCRAVLLTGANGTFCSGGAIDTVDGITSIAARSRLQAGHALVRLVARGVKAMGRGSEDHTSELQ